MKKFTNILPAITAVLFFAVSAVAQETYQLIVLLDNAGINDREVQRVHDALRATKIVRDNKNNIEGVNLRVTYYVFGVETYTARRDEFKVIEISTDTEFVRRETPGFRTYVTDCSPDSLADKRNTRVTEPLKKVRIRLDRNNNKLVTEKL